MDRLRSAAAHVIVDHLPDGLVDQVELDAASAHHLASVLRLRPGEAVSATDGRGGYRLYEYAGASRLVATSDQQQDSPRGQKVTVGFVPVKGDRPEWAVQKLTELGVDRIVMLSATRAVVRWEGERAASHLVKLQRVARAAVSQSRQCWLPEIAAAVEIRAMPPGEGVYMAEPGGGHIPVDAHTALIGPEGGWDPSEVQPFEESGRTIGLASGILRAETAAVAAGVLLTSLRAGVVSPGKRP